MTPMPAIRASPSGVYPATEGGAGLGCAVPRGRHVGCVVSQGRRSVVLWCAMLSCAVLFSIGFCFAFALDCMMMMNFLTHLFVSLRFCFALFAHKP